MSDLPQCPTLDQIAEALTLSVGRNDALHVEFSRMTREVYEAGVRAGAEAVAVKSVEIIARYHLDEIELDELLRLVAQMGGILKE